MERMGRAALHLVPKENRIKPKEQKSHVLLGLGDEPVPLYS
jgi:hypothetical protein